MARHTEIGDSPDVLALKALAHVAGHDELGPRFLALTGLDSDNLRAQAGDPMLLAAVLNFLAGHDADLISTAAALNTSPERLAAAARSLGDWDA